MQLKKWLIAVPLAMTMLTGCSLLEKLVYRIDINQGNYVEQSAVEQLKFGMTKEQVRYVMGSPMLVENGYPDTWYYIYHHTEGHNDSIQKNLIVDFNGEGQLVNVAGDFPPSKDFLRVLTKAGELESWRAGELESWRAGEVLEGWRITSTLFVWNA